MQGEIEAIASIYGYESDTGPLESEVWNPPRRRAEPVVNLESLCVIPQDGEGAGGGDSGLDAPEWRPDRKFLAILWKISWRLHIWLSLLEQRTSPCGPELRVFQEDFYDSGHGAPSALMSDPWPMSRLEA